MLRPLVEDAMKIRSTRDLLVLRFLADGPKHGAEVYADIIKVCGCEDLIDTVIYATLKRLAKNGLAADIGVRDDAPPNSKSYKLTVRGRRVLNSFAGVLNDS